MNARTEDHELRAHADHHASLRLWLRLLSCTTLIEDTIRHRLKGSFGISLSRFDLMAQLERNADGLTMGEISRRMMVSGGNVTAIVDQLEKEDLVQRYAASNDRRSIRVKLTASGRETFSKMAQEHEQWVVELFSGLSDSQQARLQSLLGSLKTDIYQQQQIKSQETP